MRTFASLFVVTALSVMSPLPQSHAQALSPDKGIDDVEVVTVSAVVDKIDLEKRKVTLTLDDGKTKTYKVGQAAVNLDQVQVGDHVKIACTEELMVVVNKSGQAPAAATIGEVNVAPRGSKPGAMIVETTAISGKILAIDLEKHKVSYEDPDGKKKTVKVRPSVDLSGLAVGDSVDAVLTESVIVDVTKS
jgi:predicted RNA-binding protein